MHREQSHFSSSLYYRLYAGSMSTHDGLSSTLVTRGCRQHPDTRPIAYRKEIVLLSFHKNCESCTKVIPTTGLLNKRHVVAHLHFSKYASFDVWIDFDHSNKCTR